MTAVRIAIRERRYRGGDPDVGRWEAALRLFKPTTRSVYMDPTDDAYSWVTVGTTRGHHTSGAALAAAWALATKRGFDVDYRRIGWHLVRPVQR